MGALSTQSPVDPDLLDGETLGGLLMGTVARYGDRRAFVYEGRELTYAELGEVTWKLARGLAAAGVTKGTRVGILMPNSPEWVCAAFAAALNGAVVVGVSPLASPAERDHILRFSDTSVLLASVRSGPRELLKELLDTYPILGSSEPGRIACADLPYLRRAFVHGLDQVVGAFEPWAALKAAGEAVPDEVVAARAAAVAPSDDAAIYFTSGSTAAPKAVLHTQRAPVIVMRATASFFGMTERDTLLGAKQFFWVGVTNTVGACIVAGACYVGLERFRADVALDLIEQEGVTAVICTDHQLDQIGRLAEASPRDLHSLRLPSRTGRLARAAGLPADHASVRGYGMTEAMGTVSGLPVDAPLELRSSTNGKPVEGLEIRIVDPESGEPLPPGQPGLVQIRGRNVMRGYLKQPPEAAFVDGYLVTQDLGYVDDGGYFHFTGRANGMIKTNAANVSPKEIEEQVRAWGKLPQAFAVGVPHPTLGEAVVLVAVGDDSSFSATDLEEFLRTRIAAFKLPKRVIFIGEAELPRSTASDKVLYPHLRAHATKSIVSSEPDSDWGRFLLSTG
jgi:acyl-CoA synthetase (AMP-forming)/AMP-acid ligase II